MAIINSLAINNNVKTIADKYFSHIKQDDKKLSLAFLTLAIFYDLNFNETIENIVDNITTDGSQDCGCDAIYLNEDEKTLYIYQSSTTLDRIELSKLKANLKDIEDIFISGKIKDKKVNQKVKDKYYDTQGKYDDIKNILIVNTEDYQKLTNIEEVKKELESVSDDYKIIDINTIEYNIKNNKNSTEKEFKHDIIFYPPSSISDNKKETSTTISFFADNIKGICGLLKAEDLCNMIKLSEQKNGKNAIFGKNIRGFLGTKINKHIQNTLNDPNKRIYFSVLNNGLTIVCTNFDSKYISGQWNVSLINPKIINGGQTSSSIYEMYCKNKESVKDVSVLCRIYGTASEELIGDIIVGTNTQTAPKQSDFLSTYPFAKSLKQYFLTSGVKLEIKNHYTNENEVFFLEDAIKYWACLYNPVYARGIGNVSKTIIAILTEDKKHTKYQFLEKLKDIQSDVMLEFVQACKIAQFVYKKIKEDLISNPNDIFLEYTKELFIYGIYKTDPKSNDYNSLYGNVKEKIRTTSNKKDDKKSMHTWFKNKDSKIEFDKLFEISNV